MRGNRLFRAFLVFFCFCSSPVVLALSVSPESLEFKAKVDAPVHVFFDIVLEEQTPVVDIAIDGFKADRQIQDLGGGKYRILIAPETSTAGAVQGRIQVTANSQAVGDPIKLSGVIEPWIEVRPQRIFLGSIGHGDGFAEPKTWNLTLKSETEDFDVEAVEFPEIEGAAWKLEPEQGIPAKEKKLSLTFAPNSLAAGLPFGALARKFAVIRITHPKASVLTVPITGMLSVNTTGRDYSTFLYKGELRWQGPWGTPNIAAMFLAMGLLLLCAFGAAVHAKLTEISNSKYFASAFKGLKWLVAASVFPALAYGCLLLVKTYSRGGWVAMGVGIVVLLMGCRGVRFYPLVLAGLFAVGIALNPQGLDRMASTGAVESDKSISNRLLLWQGALQVMAENPWRGVGSGKFGEVFMRDYQLPSHTQEYTTAINDFLTLGTERGVAPLAFAASFFVLVAGIGLVMGMRCQQPLFVGCAATIFCGMVGSWFSSIAFQSNSFYLLIASALLIGMGALWNIWRRSGKQAVSGQGAWRVLTLAGYKSLLKAAGGFVAIWLVLAVLCAGLVGVLGYLALQPRPEVREQTVAGMRGVEVRPRGGNIKGVVFYVGDRGETPESLLKNTLRPLAAKGWAVICFELLPFHSDAGKLMQEVIAMNLQKKSPDQKWFVAGHRRGGLLALELAEADAPSRVAAYMPAASGSVALESMDDLIEGIPCPILLCAQEGDSGRFAALLQKIALNESQPVLEKRIHRNEFKTESKLWQQWIEDMDRWFEEP